ncbi:hypothetical protein [Paenibacillus koleovorans]|uniref:hypothetical protein n=1 Tax=Paenibacillus koleovorans TaxID=121608 RepID=UPI000FDCBD48|nr:hypothetical protein [Paenibacillus koleovorans]
MESIHDVLQGKLVSVMHKLAEVEQLSRWADEQYRLLCRHGYDQYIRNRLLVDILMRLRDLNDPSLDDWDYGFKESNSSYYLSEIEEIIEYLEGKRKYTEVISVKENLLVLPNNQSLLLFRFITELLTDRRLSDDDTDTLRKLLASTQVNTRSDYVLNETIVTMLHINESLQFSRDEIISYGAVGIRNLNKVTLQQEKKILKDLLDIIEGKRAYRLSLCIVKQDICFTNIFPL